MGHPHQNLLSTQTYRCRPGGLTLRNELVERTFAESAAVNGGAEVVSGSVGHHSVVGKASVGRILEAVDDALRPLTTTGQGEPVDGAATATRVSAFAGGSVEIAARVNIHVADRA